MSDVLMPLNLRHARTSLRYLDSTGVSRGMFTGQYVTAAKGGDRLGLTLEFTKHGGRSTEGKAEKAQLRSFLMSLRGRQNRVYASDKSCRRRGNFPTGELLSNGMFDGTTGWAAGSQYSISAADRVLRAQRTAVTASQAAVQRTAASTVVQYAPYAGRVLLSTGRGTFSSVGISVGSTQGASDYGFTFGTAGYAALGFVPPSTSTYFSVLDNVASGLTAGDYFRCHYASLARCALADNGGNLLLFSDQFGSLTTNAATISSNAGASPDGTTTADDLLETTANDVHWVGQTVAVSSAAADFAFSCAIKPNGRDYAYLQIQENTSNTQVYQVFNVTTGAVGSTTSTGANWGNLRVFIVPLGNGYYQCSIVARKTNAATSLTALIGVSSADNRNSYVGNASLGLRLWRTTMVASSVPTRLVLSTASATTASGQTGSGMHMKGLPASTSGLLEIDDQVELVTSRGSELKIVTARLNSDAAGLGYLQFEPPIRTSPADNSPVIIHQPMGRFLFTGDLVGFDNEPGFWSVASAEFEEAL